MHTQHISHFVQLLIEATAFGTIVVGCVLAERSVRQSNAREVLRRRSMSERALSMGAGRATNA